MDLVPLAVRKELSGLMLLAVRRNKDDFSTLGCT